MPGVYKLKSCPECKKEHRKQGIFCSQSCSNSHREVSENQREHGRKLAEMNRGAPEKIAAGHLMKQGLDANSENFAINIPDIPDLPEGYDIADNW
jgi:hypothetical protein